MKISHNTHGWGPDRTDPAWAEKVEREAEQITNRTEVLWHKAQRRLARAEEKLRQAEQLPQGTAPVRRLLRLRLDVEERRDDLLSLERLMRSSPAGSQNRGRGSHRGVSRGEVL